LAGRWIGREWRRRRKREMEMKGKRRKGLPWLIALVCSALLCAGLSARDMEEHAESISEFRASDLLWFELFSS
jgi:hypothetical protein